MAGTSLDKPGHDDRESSCQLIRLPGRFAARAAAAEPFPGSKKACAKNRNSRGISRLIRLSSPWLKNIHLLFFRIICMLPAPRLDARGTFWPIVTGREAGCDGRKAPREFFARTNGAAADGEVVWS
jgi:hypothetical protein